MRKNIKERQATRLLAEVSLCVKDKVVNQFSFAIKMRLLYFLSGLAATVTVFPVKNTEDEVISKH